MGEANIKSGQGLFGRFTSYEDSKMIVLAVPWDATVSFKGGARHGPYITAKASSNMDFFSLDAPDVRDQGIHLKPPPPFLKQLNQQTREKALPILALEEQAPGPCPPALIQNINTACEKMIAYVYEEAQKAHKKNKLFCLLGGDHSVSEGALKWVGETLKGDFGLLHIDAHADLRASYQGLKYSHASVMHNVMHSRFPPKKLVQAGVRDYCKPEFELINSHPSIHTFFDSQIKTSLFEGGCFKDIADSIIKPLPQKVYISVDVDGLTPSLFAHTGAPVPGGFSFEEFCYLISRLSAAKRTIIGFDIVETADPFDGQRYLPDGSYAARLLYFLCQKFLLGR